MEKNVILSPISIGELTTVISETVEKEVSRILLISKPSLEPELLTRKQTAKVLGISLVTLNIWQKTGLVPSYRINTRIRFKRDEVMRCLNQVQTKSFGRVA